MIEVVAAVIERDGLIHCFKKGPGKYPYISNKFEFPGGKVEAGEDHKQALAREILEELETEIQVHEHLTTVEHSYPDFSIRLHFYACSVKTEINRLMEHTEYCALPRTHLRSIEWLAADEPAVEFLMSQTND